MAHIRDETYKAALACLIDAIHAQPFTKVWGDGDTSSSDGQFFRAGGSGEARADYNAKYGSEPGVKFYFAVGGEDGAAAVAGYDGRRVGQGNSRHGFQLAEVTTDSLDAISPRRHRSSRLNHELVSAGILVRPWRILGVEASEGDASHEHDPTERDPGRGLHTDPGRLHNAKLGQCRVAEGSGRAGLREHVGRRWRRRRWRRILMRC
jgi:Tn3 transposase DDE domain